IHKTIDVFLVASGEEAEAVALKFAEQVRTDKPGIRLQMNCGGGSFKNQMKKADKSGASVALILGDEEARSEQVQVKDLQGNNEQQASSWSEVAEVLGRLGL
ncbi:MAG: His/Gly/Thr/Pro-type tRNA ligase C-terminal domain-containing protein, partial [Reinekea sp.]|nr:His/Gly/Thr/Pro-type tRNA ligase C-terminal domain-containing protein [Reinekea sp.]